MDWFDLEEEREVVLSYFFEPFLDSTETNFKFPLLVRELTHLEEDWDLKKVKPKTEMEDHSLGEINVPLTSEWIREQMAEGNLFPVGLATKNIGL